MSDNKEDSPFILNISGFFPEGLDQLSHILGMLLMDPRKLVVEVADCKVKLLDCFLQQSHLVSPV